jgi:ABC-2 type transport system permease protein
LADDKGWMALRGRNYELRLLNKDVLSQDITFWKWLNIAVPLVLLLLAGVVIYYWRKRRYGR